MKAHDWRARPVNEWFGSVRGGDVPGTAELHIGTQVLHWNMSTRQPTIEACIGDLRDAVRRCGMSGPCGKLLVAIEKDGNHYMLEAWDEVAQ